MQMQTPFTNVLVPCTIEAKDVVPVNQYAQLQCDI